MAGKSGKSSKAGNASRHRSIPQHNLNQLYTRIVTSETCIVCKSQCERGIQYIKQMEQPGAVGYGVPCVLTGYRINT